MNQTATARQVELSILPRSKGCDKEESVDI